MPFVVPRFNLVCNIAGPNPADDRFSVPEPPYRVTDQVCSLVFGSRIPQVAIQALDLTPNPVLTMWLLLPAGTDIRGFECAGGSDCVECPAGSGRWYYVASVDDVGKGWSNEHRTALIQAIPRVWPVPIP